LRLAALQKDGWKKLFHTPYSTGKRDTLQNFALFPPKRLDNIRLSGMINI
jgi:hypothetical protein